MTKGLVSLALLAAAFTVGCGSGSGSADSGVGGSTGFAGSGAAGAGGTGGDVACPGVTTLYTLSTGDSCFDITGVAPNSNDGCMLGVADTGANGLVGQTLPVSYTYDMNTATLTVGTMGSLGTGAIMCNMATLARDNSPTLESDPNCSWHQSDSSMVTMTADNEFDIAVSEAQSQFAGCKAADTPAGGMCTSTWTWHMKKNDTKSPTSDPPCSK
ncbi:MAG TPA: hypothetical protein VHL80_02850 [Polyangia bacterium]|nr:hypothetical protein [Polyangia bacterium]